MPLRRRGASIFRSVSDNQQNRLQCKSAALQEPHLPRAFARVARQRAEFPCPYRARRVELAFPQLLARAGDGAIRNAFLVQLVCNALGTETPPPRRQYLCDHAFFRQPSAALEIVEQFHDLAGIFGMQRELAFELLPRILATREQPERARPQALRGLIFRRPPLPRV